MRRFDTELVALKPLARDYYELSFTWPLPTQPDPSSAGQRQSGTTVPARKPAPAVITAQAGVSAPTRGHSPESVPIPGTFITLRTGGPYDPILRRPFALSAYEPDSRLASLIFQKRGRGTAWLAGLAPGAQLDILGPLGRGFTLPPRGFRPVLAAGGIGLGPILYLARYLEQEAAAGRCEAPVTVLGFRTADQVPRLPLPTATAICTDDGSAGFHGTVVDWLLSADTGLPPAYYGCGPLPMMAALDRLAGQRQAPFQAAVEQWMACGIGACAGCALALKDGSYIKACVDGPVVDGRLVNWEA